MLWCSLKQRNTFAHRAAYSGDCISLVTHPFYPDKRGDKIFMAMPHNSKCRYGERGAADAKPKAQAILCVLASILATQMPCRTPSRSEALRSATDALRRLLTRRSAGAVLMPLGGNCAVLPKNNRHNLTRRNAAKGCACYFMRGYRSSWSWVGISSAWSGTPVQLPSGSLWLARFSSSMVCRSWWASAGV